jgi:hypothetical protein
MHRPVRSRRRRKETAARRRFLAGLTLVTAAIAAAGVAVSLIDRVPAEMDDAEVTTVSLQPAVSGPAETAPPTDAHRAVFPYSIVPGGVDSVSELRKAIATDSVVAEHYKGFDLSKARVERLDAPRITHVSYRIGQHVYWTRKALVLPAGERVITDGTTVARTRCGNQLADRPGVTSPAEPAAAVLDTPAASRPMLSVSALPVAVPGSQGASGAGSGSSAGAASGTGGGSGASGGSGSGGFIGAGGVGGGASSAAGRVSSETAGEACSAAAAPCSPDVPGGSGSGDESGTPNTSVPPAPPVPDVPFGAPPFDTPPPFGSPPPGLPPLVPNVPPTLLGPGDLHIVDTPPGDVPPTLPPLDTPPGDGPPHLDTPPGSGPEPLPPGQGVPTPVPEPGSLLLILTGAGGMLARRISARRRG